MRTGLVNKDWTIRQGLILFMLLYGFFLWGCAGDSPQSRLTQQLYTGSPAQRDAALTGLAAFDDPDTEARLFTFLMADQPGVKEAAAKIGVPKAQKILVKNLTYWEQNSKVADKLRELGWEPQTREEKVHYWAAMWAFGTLKDNWPEAKEVLVRDLESKDRLIVENAALTLVGIGKEEMVPVLVAALKKSATVNMIQGFLNSGNPNLESAAQDWVRKHRGKIVTHYGSGPRLKWGQ